MAIRNPQELKTVLRPGGRLLGLDVGDKTIGIAISDPALSIATPVETIRRTKFTDDVRQLARLMTGRNVGGMVIGMPFNMDGSEGPRCQSVRHFAQNLIGRADLLGGEPEIAFWDERLTSFAAERMMIEDVDLSRAKRAAMVDKIAATYILQGALKAMAPRPNAEPKPA